MDRAADYPLGASLTLAELAGRPYETLARLRRHEPVAWVPALDAWLVTRRATAVAVMRDATTFTVDDPRFTTARVVGPSMLSLDGGEHARQRAPVAAEIQPQRATLDSFIAGEAHRLLSRIRPDGIAELRTAVAGPLAAAVVHRALDLRSTDPDTMLAWYDAIASSVSALSTDGDPGNEGDAALGAGRRAMDELRDVVFDEIGRGSGSMVGRLAAHLLPEEVASNVAVVLFGAIETSEAATANALHHLLTVPGLVNEVRRDRNLVAALVDESMRLEPSAARVDRYATRATMLDDARIASGDAVVVSLTAAGRDPETFASPDAFDIHRPNARQHLAFAQGPHACLGAHVARAESGAAVNAVLDLLPDVRIDATASTPPRGLVFRKPPALVTRWSLRAG